MKITFLLFVIFWISNTHCYQKLPEEKEKELFSEHLLKFNIRSPRNVFNPIQFNTFISNYYDVEDHNDRFESGKEAFEKEINAFSHIPYSEFVSHHTGYIAPPYRQDVNEEEFEPMPLNRERRSVYPLSYDWRNSGSVPPVKDQGACGSCWAFAALDVIEFQMRKWFKNNETLSVQEVLNCPLESYQPNCVGGWGFVAYKYAMMHGGITKDSVYPYTASITNYCEPSIYSKSKGSNILKYVSSNYYEPTNEETIKGHLYREGPLYTTYHVAEDFYQYKSGVYTDPNEKCFNQHNNHAVVIVGYGVENGVDYWLVKNSWGAGWGDQGYFKIKRGVNLCGIARDVSFVAYVDLNQKFYN